MYSASQEEFPASSVQNGISSTIFSSFPPRIRLLIQPRPNDSHSMRNRTTPQEFLRRSIICSDGTIVPNGIVPILDEPSKISRSGRTFRGEEATNDACKNIVKSLRTSGQIC